MGMEAKLQVSKHIANSLTNSTSGQYYQDVHPMLTLDNLRSVAPSVVTENYPIWSSSKLYVLGG